jgi:hypothetical protein
LQKIIRNQKNEKNGVICNFSEKSWQVLASKKSISFSLKASGRIRRNAGLGFA